MADLENSEHIEQPTGAPAHGGREGSGQPAANEETSDPAPAGAADGQAAPAPLAGLRGAEYVKALSGHRLVSVEVPLIPSERRGDWERAKGVKIRVTTRQAPDQEGTGSPRLDRDHALTALVIALQRPGATRFDQIDLRGNPAKEAIERLSDYVNQARLRAQAQTGKKWTASQVFLVPIEDA
ncbi:MAG TPA: hypothetical protein VH599_10260 [Ktedonobacterales bacterium]|jgi:hypothetical protein